MLFRSYCRGGLRRSNPQSGKLEDVVFGKDGHLASKSTVYQAGGLCFRVK